MGWMKNKLFTVLLIGFLVFSTLNLASAEQVKCSRCSGTGEIVCPDCGGTGETVDGGSSVCSTCDGTGAVEPKIQLTSMNPYVQDGVTIVEATFKNQASVEVNATVTASIQDHSATSPEMAFPPGEGVPVKLTIDFVGTYSMLQLVQSIQIAANPTSTVTCPDCGGTVGSASATCLDCDGSGTVVCPGCKGTGYVEAGLLTGLGDGLNVPLIGGVGATIILVGVGSVVVLKKRRVSEKSLRALSGSEFQQWVLKRLDGKASTSKDAAMGIDGFSRLNEPISIKQSDSVSMAAIDSFTASLARNRARTGIIVAFGFSGDAIRGKVRAKRNGIDIQMLTIQELIYNKRR